MTQVDFERFKQKPVDSKLEVLFNRIETIENRLENIGQNLNLLKGIESQQVELLETILEYLKDLDKE